MSVTLRRMKLRWKRTVGGRSPVSRYSSISCSRVHILAGCMSHTFKKLQPLKKACKSGSNQFTLSLLLTNFKAGNVIRTTLSKKIAVNISSCYHGSMLISAEGRD